MASNTRLCTPAGTKHNGGVNDAIQRGLPQYLLPQWETSLLIFLTNRVDSIEFVSVTMSFSINLPMERSPSEWIKSLCYLVPFVPRVCCVVYSPHQVALAQDATWSPSAHRIGWHQGGWPWSAPWLRLCLRAAVASWCRGCWEPRRTSQTGKHDNWWVCQWLWVVPQRVQVCVSPAPVHCLSRHAGLYQWRWLQTRECRVPLWCWESAVNLDAHEPQSQHYIASTVFNRMKWHHTVCCISIVYIYIYIKVDVFFFQN